MTPEVLFNRVVVCGGRTYGDINRVTCVLDIIQPWLVIHGDASGADTLAKEYAESRGIPIETYAPDRALDGPGRDWKFNRNSRMLAESRPSLVVAFPGGPGTADTVNKAKRLGIPVIEISA